MEHRKRSKSKLQKIKKCTQCKEEKLLNQKFFRFRKDRNTWIAKCKDCLAKNKKQNYKENKESILLKNKKYREKNIETINSYHKCYYLANKEKIQATQRIYVENNREEIKEYKKKYYQDNKNKILRSNKDYYQNNKDKIIKKSKQWAKENKTHRRIYEKHYRKEKRKEPSVKLKQTVSSQIRNALKRNGSSKRGESVLNYLPYSVCELKKHIESQFEDWMSWDNWGVYIKEEWNDDDPSTWTWQIDHIIPHSKFTYTSMADDSFLKCWALNNLRPLSSKKNLSLGSKTKPYEL